MESTFVYPSFILGYLFLHHDLSYLDTAAISNYVMVEAPTLLFQEPVGIDTGHACASFLTLICCVSVRLWFSESKPGDFQTSGGRNSEHLTLKIRIVNAVSLFLPLLLLVKTASCCVTEVGLELLDSRNRSASGFWVTRAKVCGAVPGTMLTCKKSGL